MVEEHKLMLNRSINSNKPVHRHMAYSHKNIDIQRVDEESSEKSK